MKYISLSLLVVALLSIFPNVANAQKYQDYQLRLEPVWSRVADALGEIGSVESVEFSPDGRYIVSGTKFDNSVIMWRTSDGAELWRKNAEQEIERVGWSADGKYVAAASEDFRVTIYDAKDGALIKIIEHSEGIDGLTWSHKGNLLVTGEELSIAADKSKHGWIRVFDIPGGKELIKFDFGNTVNELFFTEDDKYLLAVGHGAVKVYRVADWTLVKT
jgi:WD40 repeat protein